MFFVVRRFDCFVNCLIFDLYIIPLTVDRVIHKSLVYNYILSLTPPCKEAKHEISNAIFILAKFFVKHNSILICFRSKFEKRILTSGKNKKWRSGAASHFKFRLLVFWIKFGKIREKV